MKAENLHNWQDIFGDARDIHEVRKVPSVEQYIEGLQRIEGSTKEKQRQILIRQYFAPNRAIAASEVIDIYNNKAPIAITSGYIAMAKRFCKAMSFRPIFRSDDEPITSDYRFINWKFDEDYDSTVSGKRVKGKIRYWAVWANSYKRFDDKEIWVMHPEVAYALEAIGWVDVPISNRKEISTEAYAEGKVREIRSKSYERNPAARRACLEIYGYRCQVCNLLLQEKYGDVAAKVIHVHHRTRLSKTQKEIFVNPQTDLIPICPNCHSVIHSRDPEYTIDEVKLMITNTRKCPS